MVVSVLAYAGLRPHELRALRWGDIGATNLVVRETGKTGARSVRLLAPLRQDLAGYRMKLGRPDDGEFIFPAEREHDGSGGEWTANGINKWGRRVLRPAAEALGRSDVTAYYLRHSFASLLAHEGRSVVYIAEQLGHSPDLSVRVYQHVLTEFEDAPRLDAETAIRQAREAAPVVATG
jgi:integrase